MATVTRHHIETGPKQTFRRLEETINLITDWQPDLLTKGGRGDLTGKLASRLGRRSIYAGTINAEAGQYPRKCEIVEY